MAGVSTPGPCGMLAMVRPVSLLLLLVFSAVRAEQYLKADRQSCFEIVNSWEEAQLRELASLRPEDALDRVRLRDLVFFLHIPRTGGRTFHQCFLKHLFPSDERCPRSYDTLRIDRSQPRCRLISTHDDYSLLDKLPQDVTSVVTSLRRPVDRVLSAYEFSIEVAARAFRRTMRRTIPRVRSPLVPVKGSKIMNTLDIWPWKYLVPLMESDLFARRDARRGVPSNTTGVSVDDTYDAPLIAMPLHEFIDHPVAHELLHNGATFQVAGLTNTSFSENAGVIRKCVVRFPPLGQLVVDVAKKRLDRMLYVGLTDRQNESALFFAKVLGDQISMEGFMRSILSQRGARSKTVQSNFTSLDEFTEEEMTDEMLAAYEWCVADLRRSQETRRLLSLEMVKPISFSRGRRKVIPDSVTDKISAYNSLDAELYVHAQVLFQQQQKFLELGSFHFVKEVMMSREDSGSNIDITREDLKANYELPFFRIYSTNLTKLVTALWVLGVLVIFMTAFYVVRIRPGARVKEF